MRFVRTGETPHRIDRRHWLTLRCRFTGTRRCPMPWSTTSAMTQRLLFIRDFELGVFSFAALGARYGVSRETGYAVLARYRRGGRAGLEEHSRRPHHSPRQTPAAL